MLVDAKDDIPLVVSHVINKRITLHSCFIIPAGIKFRRRRQCLMDARVQIPGTDRTERSVIIRALSVSPCLIVRKRDIMLHSARIIVRRGTYLPIVIFLRRGTRFCFYVKRAVIVECISAASVRHDIFIQIVPLHAEVEKAVPMVIKFLIMVVNSKPAVGRFYHPVKPVVILSGRNSRQFINIAAQDKPPKTALDIHISVSDK